MNLQTALSQPFSTGVQVNMDLISGLTFMKK